MIWAMGGLIVVAAICVLIARAAPAADEKGWDGRGE